jgi:hypothetical protein
VERCRFCGSIYLEKDRNAQGLIGPIDFEALDEGRLREQIHKHSPVTDKEAWKRDRPFQLAIVEQCSYDGTICNAASLIYTPLKDVDLGGEWIFGKRRTSTDDTGTLSRFDLMARCSF